MRDERASTPDGQLPPTTVGGLIRVLRGALRPGDTRGAIGPRRSGVVSGSVHTSAINLANMGLSFVLSVLLSRTLGTRGYGAYVYALAWPALLSIPAQLGHGALLVRDVASYAARQEWGLVRGIIRRSQRLVVVASSGVVALAAAAGWAFVGHNQPLVRRSFFIALLLVPVCSLVSMREAVLRGFQRVALGRVSEAVVQPAMLISLIGAASLLLPRPISSPVAVTLTLVSCTCALVVGTYLVRRATPVQVKDARVVSERKRWSESARTLFLVSGVTVLNLQIGIIALSALKDVDATAVFSAALRLSALVGFLQAAVIFPLAPAIARLYSTGTRAQLQRLVSAAALGVLVCSVPVALALVAFGGRALALFGDQFTVGQTALTLLVVGELVNVASGFVAVILVNTHEERALLTTSAAIAALSVGLNLALIPGLGLEGAALARAITVVSQNVALAVLVWRRLGIYSPGVGNRVLMGARSRTKRPR